MKSLLFNPFKKHTDKALLISGLVITVLGSLLGYWMNARFDGVIDLHFGRDVARYIPLAENLIDILSCVLLLYPLGKVLNKKTRVFDIFIIVMISRIPIYLMTLMNINDFMVRTNEKIFGSISQNPENLQQINLKELTENIMDHIGFISITSIVGILILIWQIALLYNGFKVATNAKGTRLVFLFVVGVIVAEILSKFLIYIFF